MPNSGLKWGALVGVALLVGVQVQRCTALLPSYVLPVFPAGNQLVATTSRQVQLQFGQQTTVRSTVDTGSGLTDLECATPMTMTGPTDIPPGVYVWSNTTTSNVNSTECALLGLGNCMAGGSCWWSSALTGGADYHTYSGVMASDTLSFPGSTPALSIANAPFGCSQSYSSCTRQEANCPASLQGCPPTQQIVKPGKGAAVQGIEFGFTFSQSSTPSELVRRGMIDEVLGLCFQPPAVLTNCSAAAAATSTTQPTSYVVLGRATPPNATIVSVPMILTPVTFEQNIPPPNSAARALTFRTPLLGVSVAVFGQPSNVTTTNYTSGQYNVLWDSGAYAKLGVGPDAYAAYLAYFQAALANYNTTSAGGIYQGQYQSCDATQYCGSNYMGYPGSQGPATCMQLPVSSTLNTSTTSSALIALKLLYPPSINFTVASDTVIQIPTTNPIYDCANNQVTVCSYASDGYPWIASPWFEKRWVQFDASQPMQGYPWSNGTMSFSAKHLSSCGFLLGSDDGEDVEEGRDDALSSGTSGLIVPTLTGGSTTTATATATPTSTSKPSGGDRMTSLGSLGSVGLLIVGLISLSLSL